MMQTAPRRFQFLEVGAVEDLVELDGEHLVDLADPVLDVGLDILGDHLARLDDLVQELFEVASLRPVGFLIGLGAEWAEMT